MNCLEICLQVLFELVYHNHLDGLPGCIAPPSAGSEVCGMEDMAVCHKRRNVVCNDVLEDTG